MHTSCAHMLRKRPAHQQHVLDKDASPHSCCRHTCCEHTSMYHPPVPLADEGVAMQSACLLLDLGVDPYMMDKAIQFGFGMPMGPFRSGRPPARLLAELLYCLPVHLDS